jgi:hypothetical protein
MSRRELVEPQPGDKRYARRNRKGQFAESDDVGHSLQQDHSRRSAMNVKALFGSVALLALGAGTATAGPCTGEIDNLTSAAAQTACWVPVGLSFA